MTRPKTPKIGYTPRQWGMLFKCTCINSWKGTGSIKEVKFDHEAELLPVINQLITVLLVTRSKRNYRQNDICSIFNLINLYKLSTAREQYLNDTRRLVSISWCFGCRCWRSAGRRAARRSIQHTCYNILFFKERQHSLSSLICNLQSPWSTHPHKLNNHILLGPHNI